MKRISILGSTGSIGKQTLDVVREHKDKFEVIAISANSSIELLLEQIKEFKPKYVAVYNEESAQKLKNMIPSDINIEVLSGMEGLKTISSLPEIDVLLTAIVGMIGLVPTLEAIKHKKDSSMVVGFNMLKQDEGDVFISAGNSGALLAGATLLVGRIKGIDRPALAGILPAYKSQLLLMDCGSNTNCKPINLLQFAQMSTIYLRNTFGIEKPAIGLLNIGTEETKGNELVKESYQLLKEKSEELGINFIGNVEGRDAFSGKIDAIVTDGFTGNVFLKTTEGLGKFVKKSLKESMMKNILSKIASIPSLPAINRFAKTMDYKAYGGALFLGVKKPVVKAHGSSDEILFEYTIIQAEKFVENKAVDKMIEQFTKNNEDSNKNVND